MTDGRFPLAFACDWKRNRRSTWSHTPDSLFTAMSGREDILLRDIDVAPPLPVLRYYQISGARFVHGRLKSRFRFAPGYLRSLEGRLRSRLPAAGPFDAVLQMGDLGVVDGAPSFLYQDLSIDLAMRYLRETGRRITAYEQFDERDLMRRREHQRRVYAHAAGVFAMSRWMADSLVRDSGLPPERVHVVHAGVHVRPSRADTMPEAGEPDRGTNRRVLFIGRDFQRKGGALVVEAYRRLRATTDVPAILVVAGPRRWPLPGGVPAGVEFLGDATWDVLSAQFERASLFCMPSYAEGFGIVFAEALCHGVPCIARNTTAMPDTVHDGVNGFLFDGDDPAALADLVARALDDDALRARTRAGAERARAYYSWDRVADDMLRIIRAATG